MISIVELQKELSSFAVRVSDKQVLQRAIEMCVRFGIRKAETFVDEWIAFQASRGCELSLNTLKLLEQELQKSDKFAALNASPSTPARKTTTTPGSARATASPFSSTSELLLNAYADTSKLREKRARLEFLDEKPLNISGKLPFSEQMEQDGNVSTSAYDKRDRAGHLEVLYDCGCAEMASQANDDEQTRRNEELRAFRNESQSQVTVQSIAAAASEQRFVYGWQKLVDQADILDQYVEEMTAKVCAAHKLSGTRKPVGSRSCEDGENFLIAGRIQCDLLEHSGAFEASNAGKNAATQQSQLLQARLNRQCVLLEGSGESSGGKHVRLLLDRTVSPWSLFPGQVVVAEGRASTEAEFHVQRLYLPSPRLFLPAKLTERCSNVHAMVTIACGPFTTSDNLHYEPLHDLMKALVWQKPHVLLLLGPFVDSRHQLASCNAAAFAKGDKRRPYCYSDLFTELLALVSNVCARTGTKLLLLPSQRDAHHAYVYPQPAFKLPPNCNAIALPDPATVQVSVVGSNPQESVQFLLGASSTDSLMQLAAEEISGQLDCEPRCVERDRIARLVEHHLAHQSYYPLYPPLGAGLSNEPSNVTPLDLTLFERFGRFPAANISKDSDENDSDCQLLCPHVLVLPSELKQFAKKVAVRRAGSSDVSLNAEPCESSSVLAVNPGRLARNTTGGTYMNLMLRFDANAASQRSIADFATVQLVRI